MDHPAGDDRVYVATSDLLNVSDVGFDYFDVPLSGVSGSYVCHVRGAVHRGHLRVRPACRDTSGRKCRPSARIDDPLDRLSIHRVVEPPNQEVVALRVSCTFRLELRSGQPLDRLFVAIRIPKAKLLELRVAGSLVVNLVKNETRVARQFARNVRVRAGLEATVLADGHGVGATHGAGVCHESRARPRSVHTSHPEYIG